MAYSYKPPRNPVPYIFLVKRHQYVRSILKANSQSPLILDLGCSKYKVTSDAISLDFDGAVKPDIMGSGLNLPFKDSVFDSVTALELIEHFNSENQDSFLEEVKRILKPKGQFIVSTPNISEYTRKIHDLLWFISHWIYARKDLGKHIGELTHSQLNSKLTDKGFRMKSHKSFTLFNYVVEVEKK